MLCVSKEYVVKRENAIDISVVGLYNLRLQAEKMFVSWHLYLYLE